MFLIIKEAINLNLNHLNYKTPKWPKAQNTFVIHIPIQTNSTMNLHQISQQLVSREQGL